MDLFDLLLHFGVITAGIVGYLILRNSEQIKGNYRLPGWNYYLKLPCAYFFVKKWKKKRALLTIDEFPRKNLFEGTDDILLQTASPDGATVVVGMRKICSRQLIAEVTVYLKLENGIEYFVPKHPEPVVGRWQDAVDGWRCGGLVIQVLETNRRLRLLYDGELKNMASGELQHVKFNMIWATATRVFHFPQDWSNELAACALAFQPWHGDSWNKDLNMLTNTSTCQFGAAQGRIQIRDESENLVYNDYVRTRGSCVRNISTRNPRREVALTICSTDGTAISFNAFSYPDNFTECYSGNVRMPNFTSWPITSTDLMLSDFCETPDSIPKAYTLHVGTSEKQLKVILRINQDGGRVLSGVPYSQEIHYRTVHVDINGFIGTGVLQLTYQTKSSIPVQPTILQPTLRWLSESEVGSVSYCASFDSKVAACPSIVGGKGASLALLTTKQKEQGYKVPPGFCVTYLALEQHFKSNPQIVAAIKQLEAATVNYNESDFKQKCEKVVELFNASEIESEIKDEVLSHLEELEKTAIAQNYGPDVVFAVRSSAVGEDSESLSAAGQNSTVLGCSKHDVVDAVKQCWASMYAFHSVYYRRSNGQACACGGSVTIQTLVRVAAAGVMFTTHQTPSNLLIAANYGLGESVVSGSAEPDTIVVRRDMNSALSIAQITVGDKRTRVEPTTPSLSGDTASAPSGDTTSTSNGVTEALVSEEARRVLCVAETDLMRLANIGVQQEILWGAPRDIEWGILNGEIYLLQARPITSLERWTEEELLHEVDMPIMSDDELLTFANTGEVMPKPISALSYDLVSVPLSKGVNIHVGTTKNQDSCNSIVMTHYRACLPLYNSVYKMVPNKINLGMRVTELGLHGRTVADEQILATALHRRKPKFIDKFIQFAMMKFLFTSKSWGNQCVRTVDQFNPAIDSTDLTELIENITNDDISKKFKTLCACHAATTTASLISQIIAMTVLLEGKEDFTLEQCSEISTILSCGNVVSADVPQALSNICRSLKTSGRYDEFRKLPPDVAMDWLKENLPDIRREVDKFLEQHGHRAIMEFDLATKPWVLVPEQMMKVLQNMTLNSEEINKQKSVAEIVAALKTPKKSLTSKILTWVLPLCQRLVRQREQTKSLLILGVHKLRLTILDLGKEMVKQWYLPEVDLIFHFRLHELSEFIRTREPALLRKATQRRQYTPAWTALKYAELQFGWPKPEEQKTIEYAADASIRGTGVCGGEVVARACVLTDLADIGALQRGDILITGSTDIGWSPYFPLLAGVVTELGGLISHGAVIAREYGLPCVVGAKDATNIFKTGDTVRLSATEGLIERVQLKD